MVGRTEDMEPITALGGAAACAGGDDNTELAADVPDGVASEPGGIADPHAATAARTAAAVTGTMKRVIRV